jgi:hypothetical protein
VRIDLHFSEIAETSTRMASVDVRRVLVAINVLARTNALRGTYATGRLASSVKVTGPRIAGEEIIGSVGSALRYAATHDQGSKRHKIRAKPGQKLSFYWRRVGRFVQFDAVNHPGTRPYHWLSTPAEDVGRRNNYRVVIHSGRR